LNVKNENFKSKSQEQAQLYKDEIENDKIELQRLNATIQELEIKWEKESEEKHNLQKKIDELKKQLANQANLLATSHSQSSSNSSQPQLWDLTKNIEELQLRLQEKSEDVERLESEVEQWVVASEQLQKLGEEAVKEANEEVDRLKEDVQHWQSQFEQQVKRRREAEAELANSETKLNDLDNMLRKLMTLG